MDRTFELSDEQLEVVTGGHGIHVTVSHSFNNNGSHNNNGNGSNDGNLSESASANLSSSANNSYVSWFSSVGGGNSVVQNSSIG